LTGRRRRLGAGRAGPLPQPTWSAWLANMASGPSGQWPWVKRPYVQKVHVQYFISRKIAASVLKFVKCIEYYLFIRKMQMTYQNVQKNKIYILVSKSCILKQI
jgi:hypothetical protein